VITFSSLHTVNLMGFDFCPVHQIMFAAWLSVIHIAILLHSID